jgi:choline-sulfatase
MNERCNDSVPEAPNIVFVCSDQHSYRYAGFAGHDHVDTPALDEIADRGVVFENAYCNNPVCTPSRASLMTGVYASDVGSYCNATVWDGSSPTWGTRLRDAGYHTWATGKLDLNGDEEIGFEQVDTHNGHWEDPDITSLFRRPVVPRNRIPDRRAEIDGQRRDSPHEGDSRRTENAEAFLLDRSSDVEGPWAAYVGYHEPHPPFEARAEYFDRYYPTKVQPPNVPPEHIDEQHPVQQDKRHYELVEKPLPEEQIRRCRAGYYGMISELDDYVGRLWRALDEAGELENTIFVYTSDHGEMLGEHGQWNKVTLYEDAVHVPLVMAGPGLPTGERVETPVSLVDVVYTLLEWGGAELDDELRGHSLTSLLGDETAEQHPGYAFAECHGHGTRTGSFAIRTERWKYVHYTWHEDCLYDLEADPREFRNRIDDPDVEHIRDELRGHLHGEVDPEETTRAAFDAQESMLEKMADGATEEEFAERLIGRIDEGLARALAHKYAT